MAFTEEQLVKIAAWEPADNRFVANDPVAEFIRPAVSTLSASGRWQCHIVEDGGLSNYYSIVIHQSLDKQELSRSRHCKPYSGNCVLINLSLMVPIGVLGHGSFTIASDNLVTWSCLDLDTIVAPAYGSDELVDAILDAFKDSIYHFVDRDAVSQCLPPHIAPEEYCLGAKPWDRVFHVLFANTD
jgi:hypothetical protein